MIIRPFTLISGLLFAFSGAYLFGVKHQSQMLDQQISSVNSATQQDEQSIRVLQAQWALEADPSRLASLAAQFTGLQPMKPSQLVTLASLGQQLPAPGSAAPTSNPDDPVQAVAQIAAATPTAPAPAAPAAPATPAAAAPAATVAQTPKPPSAPPSLPAQLAARAPEPAPAQSAAAPVTRVAANDAHMQRAEALLHGGLAHHATHVVHHQAESAIYLAGNTPHERAPVEHVADIAPPTPVPAGAADDGGSLLGMANGGSN
jgi:hypothetical protein